MVINIMVTIVIKIIFCCKFEGIMMLFTVIDYWVSMIIMIDVCREIDFFFWCWICIRDTHFGKQNYILNILIIILIEI
jgi:hypothetical protein